MVGYLSACVCWSHPVYVDGRHAWNPPQMGMTYASVMCLLFGELSFFLANLSWKKTCSSHDLLRNDWVCPFQQKNRTCFIGQIVASVGTFLLATRRPCHGFCVDWYLVSYDTSCVIVRLDALDNMLSEGHGCLAHPCMLSYPHIWSLICISRIY